MPDWVFDFSLFGMPFHFWTGVFFVFGSLVGSFLNVCIYRMPRNESVYSPPSHCPHCGYQIPMWLNVPIITWLWLRGKCANCRAPISVRYLLIELLTAVAFASTWLYFGHQSPVVPWAIIVLLAIFIGSSAIDFEHLIIPDEFTLGGTVAGFLLSAAIPALQGCTTSVEAMKRSGIGIAIGVALVYAVVRLGKLLFGRERVAVPPGSKVIFHEEGIALADKALLFGDIFYRRSDTIVLTAQTLELPDRCYRNVEVRLRPETLMIADEVLSPEDVPYMEAVCDQVILPREAMGFGDVKFMAAIGAFLGWQAVVFSFGGSALMAAGIGVSLIIIGRRDWSSRLPFGPYIAAAATVWIFGGSRLWQWYWERLRGG